ncbi:ATP-grasp fold amidoligase family protein [Shimia aestuarii]|uniref:ATP-grasp fold amidoligase family protein n=1 Tax=Shimia aestuarii TaxID=254406 RepID=UPI001FB38DAE|nr:ATP-grasp fold amidoligase family protein [Shimia aestuarii]
MMTTSATTMTPDCALFLERIKARANKARRRARFLPRQQRQAFIYDQTFQNDIESVAHPLAEGLGRIPDFRNPSTYSEKLRSLYLTYPNPLMSLAADKIEMRRYCDYMDTPIKPPRLVAVHNDPHDLDLSDLPQTAMIKVSDGCKMNILHGPGMPVTPFAYRRFLREQWHIDHWRRHGELHYRDIPKRILVEEALLPANTIREPGIHCAFGKPYLVRSFPERRFTPLQDEILPFARDYDRPIAPLCEVLPEPWREAMLETARRLSAPLPHCRIDFMLIGDRCYLSELTLSPSGFFKLHKTPSLERRRAELYDFGLLPDTLAQGRRIAAKLGWPTETSFGHVSPDDPRLATGGQ